MEQLIDESNALMARLEFSVEETAELLESLIKDAWRKIDPIVKCHICGSRLEVIACEVDEHHWLRVMPCQCSPA